MIVSVEYAADLVGEDPNSTQFQKMLAAADEWVKRYCGRDFERGIYTEVIRALGGNVVYLKETPVESISELWVDPTGEFIDVAYQISDATTYHLEGPHNVNYRLVWEAGAYYTGAYSVKIIYTGGFWPIDDIDPLHVPKMPADLALAVAKIAKQETAGGGGVTFESEKLGDYMYQRSKSSGGPYDNTVMDILRQHEAITI